MKILTNRTEIAKALNFGEYPVIRIACKPDARDNDVIRGGAVKVLTHQYEGKDAYERCHVNFYANNYMNDGHRNMSIGSYGIGITAGMSLSDLDEMAVYANAPKIKKGDTVAFVLIGKKYGAVVTAGVKMVRSFCQKSAWLEDGAEDLIAKLAWAVAEDDAKTLCEVVNEKCA